MSQLNIQYLFATPMAEIEYENASDLNPRLEKRILEMETEGDKHRDYTKRSTQHGPLYESHFDLFALPDTEFREIGAFCHKAVSSVVAQLSTLSQQDFGRLSFHYDAWFHVSRHGAFQGLHNHPNASWSGIYCVNPGDRSDEHPMSGVVRFQDPRPNILMYADPGNEHLNDKIRHTYVDLRHGPGRLTLFPSYISHEIFPYFGEQPRIVIAFNCSIRGTDG